MDEKEAKQAVRAAVWRRLEERGAARFPKPIRGRIPNFVGAEVAARRIVETDAFKRAKTVKVNPDSPQRLVRELIIACGKTLLMPTPRLRDGFLLIESGSVPEKDIRKASTIGGAAKYGTHVDVFDIPDIDLIVMGSVAVSEEGGRLGKGHGYAEIEYGILAQLKRVSAETPVLTSVHDLQIVHAIPVEDHDVPVDLIATPTKLIETRTRLARPKGILWDKVTPTMLEEMPVLKAMREGRHS